MRALVILLAPLLVLAPACHKEIGELCKDDSECEFECYVASFPGAARTICTKPCDNDADCPAGTNCHLQLNCARDCKTDADCLDGTACDGTRCLPICQSDDQCGNNGCSMPGSLCDF